MPRVIVRSLFLVREGRIKKVRIAKEQDDKVQVIVRECKRDNREKVDGKANPKFGQMVYKTVRNIDVFEATGDEVVSVVAKGLETASKK